MVLDKIENAGIYQSLSQNISKGLKFLVNTDFSKIPSGRYEIEKDQIFALVSEYETQDSISCKIENHRKYLDIQYMVSGTEYIGYMHDYGQLPTEAYDETKDRSFYMIDTIPLLLPTGSFVIFWPGDLHQPGIKADKSQWVKKVVVKIKL